MESPAESAARKIIRRIRAGMSGAHEYRQIDWRTFPHLDRAFYERTSQELERRGFVPVGDVEDATIKAQTPDPRTFLRLMRSGDDRTVAAFYHVKPGLGWRVLMWLFGMRISKVVELESEFSDGGFVSTVTAPRGVDLPTPPQWKRSHHDPRMPLDQLLEHHAAGVAAYVAATPGVAARTAHTLEQVLAMQNRQIAMHRAYLEEVGWVTREYLERQAGGNKKFAGEIYEEAQRLVRNEMITGRPI